VTRREFLTRVQHCAWVASSACQTKIYSDLREPSKIGQLVASENCMQTGRDSSRKHCHAAELSLQVSSPARLQLSSSPGYLRSSCHDSPIRSKSVKADAAIPISSYITVQYELSRLKSDVCRVEYNRLRAFLEGWCECAT
jgi:hypothetical protein